MLDQQQLKKLMHYNADTGLFTWIAKPSNRVNLGDVAGTHSSYGYIFIMNEGRRYSAHRLACLYMKGQWPTHQMDHINHVRDDNRWVNLREATHLENHHNQSMNKNNTSGHTGVYWEKAISKWRARIWNKGKKIHLGVFTSKAAAIAARKEANTKYGYHVNHGN